jgi:hypothetical protein
VSVYRPTNVPTELIPLVRAVDLLGDLWTTLRIDEPTAIDEAIVDVLEAYYDTVKWERIR